MLHSAFFPLMELRDPKECGPWSLTALQTPLGTRNLVLEDEDKKSHLAMTTKALSQSLDALWKFHSVEHYRVSLDCCSSVSEDRMGKAGTAWEVAEEVHSRAVQ